MSSPAAFPILDKDEEDAVNLLKWKLDNTRVKADLRTRDKYPNVDGTLELVNEASIPVGKFDVQVKKVPEDAKSYSCPVELYEYSKVSSLPILLVICDTKKKRVMWRHIHSSMPEFKEGQKTFTVKFHTEDEIDDSLRYLYRWIEIAADYNNRIEKYPLLHDRVSNQLELDDILESDIVHFQIYITELNNLLDKEFQIIKERLFPKMWRLSVGIVEAGSDRVTYQHQKVQLGSNLPSVTKVASRSLEHILNDPNIVRYSWSSRSSIRSPRDQALGFLEDSVSAALTGFRFAVTGEALAQNVISDFIKLYPKSLGLSPSDSYSLHDVRAALYVNLPNACHQYLPLPEGSVVPPLGILELSELERVLPAQPATFAAANQLVSSYEVRTRDVPIQAFADAVTFLDSIGLERVRNPWSSVGQKIGYLHALPTEVRKDIETLLSKALISYEQFVNGNSLALRKSPYLQLGLTTIFHLKETINAHSLVSVWISQYTVDNSDMSLPRSLVITEDNASRVHFDTTANKLFVDERERVLLSWQMWDSNWIFNSFPYLKFIYRMLRNDLKLEYGFQSFY